MARARAKVKPPAVLEPRRGDQHPAIADLERVALFADLSRQPEWQELPGTWLLRHYHQGDVVCRQNEPGWTAFYILTPKDREELGVKLAREGGDPQPVMSVQLMRPPLRRAGFWPFRRGGDPEQVDRAVLREGELFGEISCLYRTPRSATVEVTQECFVLEVLRNILDKMYSNQNRTFKQQLDANYRARVLELHVRGLPVFRDLDEATFRTLRDQVQLEEKEPGDLIFDEHDPPDGLYVIRSGFVRVVKHVSALVGLAEVSDWRGFCAGLHAAGQEPDGPQRKVWELLADSAVRDVLGRGAQGADLSGDKRSQILFAVNALLQQPGLSAAPEFRKVIQEAGWEPEAPNARTAVRKWEAYRQVTAFNRRLLEAVLPGVVPARAGSAEPARTLSYRSGGDLIGERGCFQNVPRSATCVAYDHPASKFGRVELVRIDRALFEEVWGKSAEVRRRIQQVVADRDRETEARLRAPAWTMTGVEMSSERFDELGLIQGQKLMLIDLDRCTRCDKCVQACVDTHPDGRSRLFLDGPRLQVLEDTRVRNYLLPATCRQCRDPICLIGCPVGSIHKGVNGQIVIEDWCIGCRRCAEQCPYGAIQMHAVGVVPRGAHGWHYRRAPAGALSDAWKAAGFDGCAWRAGPSPFVHDRDFGETLGAADLPADVELQFRYEFPLTEETLREAKSFHLQVMSRSPAVTVWVNGHEVIPTSDGGGAPLQRDKQEEWTLEAFLGPAGGPALATAPAGAPALQGVLCRGRNAIAVQARRPATRGGVVLDLGLYRMTAPVVPSGLAEFTQEWVMNQAVVCDMCSEQFGRRPACVNACPHDAAMRVVATEKLPLRSLELVCRAEPQPASAAVQ
jgi:Fe-S-cluster-containing hydrogenase component 2/CRP-like cAMP-binding protein